MYDSNVAASLTFHDPELELAFIGGLIFPTREVLFFVSLPVG